MTEHIPPTKFISRYDVLGPPNGCGGDCEGTSLVPVFRDEVDPIYRRLWTVAEIRHATDDGWHFVPCPECNPHAKEDLVYAL